MVRVSRTINSEVVVVSENYRSLDDAINARDTIVRNYDLTGKLEHSADEKTRRRLNAIDRLGTSDVVEVILSKNTNQRLFVKRFECEICGRDISKSHYFINSTKCLKCIMSRESENQKKALQLRNDRIEQNKDNSLGVKNVFYNHKTSSYFVEIVRDGKLFKASFKDLEEAIRVKEEVLKFYKDRSRIPESYEIMQKGSSMKYKNITQTPQGYYNVTISRGIDGKRVRVHQNFKTLEEAISGRDQIIKNFKETGQLKSLKDRNDLHNIYEIDNAYQVHIVRMIEGERIQIVEKYDRLEDAIAARDYILDVFKRTGKLVNYMNNEDRAIYRISQRKNVDLENIVVGRDRRDRYNVRDIGFYCKNCSKAVMTRGSESVIYRDQLCKSCRAEEIEKRNQRILDQHYKETGSRRIRNIFRNSRDQYKLELHRYKERIIFETTDLDRLLRIKDFALNFFDSNDRLPTREEILEAERNREF